MFFSGHRIVRSNSITLARLRSEVESPGGFDVHDGDGDSPFAGTPGSQIEARLENLANRAARALAG